MRHQYQGVDPQVFGSGTRASTQASCFFLRNSDSFHSSSDSESSQHYGGTDVENILAKEMERLTVQARENVYEDVHGVAKAIHETPELVQQSLQELDRILSTRRNKAAYEKAYFLNSWFCKRPDFRLMFLRADQFHADNAAKRIIEHFEIKQRLFGDQHLAKPIYWEDLKDEDRELIRTGAVQMFPFVIDRSGRSVFYNLYKFRKNVSTESLLRVYWYLIINAVEHNQETQKKGGVAVSDSHGVGLPEYASYMINQSANVLLGGLPVRLVATHFLYDDPRMRPLFGILIGAAPSDVRVRVKSQYGSPMEAIYSLSSFGIPSTEVPMDENGALRSDLLQERIQRLLRDEHIRRRRRVEELGDRVEIPADLDVCMGRGMSYQRHPGTVRMMKLVELFKPKHDTAPSRYAKTDVCMEVLQVITAEGGRFLKRHESEDGWVVVPEDIAREKIAMGFRNLSRTSSKNSRMKSTS